MDPSMLRRKRALIVVVRKVKRLGRRTSMQRNTQIGQLPSLVEVAEHKTNLVEVAEHKGVLRHAVLRPGGARRCCCGCCS